MERPILYSYFISSCSWRVRIALAYKGLHYELKHINLDKGESCHPDYLKINPLGQVPALVVKGTPLLDSIAIMEYLEEAHPEIPLMPKDLFQRAKVRTICQAITSGIQPLQSPKVAKNYSEDPEKQKQWTQFYIAKGFTGLEILLGESSGGKFCVGNDLSMADLCLVPQVYNAETRFHVDLTPFPNIMKIYRALLEHEAVKSTHPLKNKPEV